MSREIDSLVAEHVMGLRVNLDCETPEVDDNHGCVYDMPEYSTDIAAAWEVVERLNIEGLHACIRVLHRPSCRFKSDTVWADTTPKAICLAALKAKGIDIGGWE